MARIYEETHIINKILKLDRAIRDGNYPNSTYLSSLLEVSTKTVGRYINILKCDYDAPIEFDSHKNGYYYTDKNFFIQNIMLKEGELLTISAIIPLLEQYKNTPLESNFKSIMGKITNMLPDNVSVDSSLINNEVHFISGPITYLEEGVFEALLLATKTHKVMELEYKSAQNKNYELRQFDPYHMICQKGSWYVIGFSHHSNEVRIYALPRIRKAKILEKSFSVPKDFKLEKHIDPNFGIWDTQENSVKVEVLFDKSIKTFVLEREWHKKQTVTENEDESVTVTFETNQINEALRWIMQFAGHAKAINPPELVEEVKNAAKKILSSY